MNHVKVLPWMQICKKKIFKNMGISFGFLYFFLAVFLSPVGVWKTHITVGGSSRCCCTFSEAQHAVHPSIMPPNGSTTGKCQSRDSGICNVRQAAHLASVSPLTLTQHSAKGTCPLCRTSSVVSHAIQSEGKWLLGISGIS